MTIVGQEDLVVAGSPKATDLTAGGNAIRGRCAAAHGSRDVDIWHTGFWFCQVFAPKVEIAAKWCRQPKTPLEKENASK